MKSDCGWKCSMVKWTDWGWKQRCVNECIRSIFTKRTIMGWRLRGTGAIPNSLIISRTRGHMIQSFFRAGRIYRDFLFLGYVLLCSVAKNIFISRLSNLCVYYYCNGIQQCAEFKAAIVTTIVLKKQIEPPYVVSTQSIKHLLREKHARRRERLNQTPVLHNTTHYP